MQSYVDSRRLEITCGEAPYVVSRYDAATGEIIPIRDRIGLLDRKLRVVNENADGDAEWLKWALRALQSSYGYEFQGDNLLIARVNVLITFAEHYGQRSGGRKAPAEGRQHHLLELLADGRPDGDDTVQRSEAGGRADNARRLLR